MLSDQARSVEATGVKVSLLVLSSPLVEAELLSTAALCEVPVSAAAAAAPVVLPIVDMATDSAGVSSQRSPTVTSAATRSDGRSGSVMMEWQYGR